VTSLAAAPTTRHQRGTTAYRRITVALFCAGLSTFTALYAVQAVLPSLSDAFALSPTQASLAVSVATGALALGVLPLTAVSEIVGRTTVMAVSLFTSAGLSTLIALSPNFTVLLVLRAAEGLALAGIQAVAMSYLAEELHRDSLGSAMGLYVAGTGLGGMAGRLLGALVDDVAGWRWALGATALVTFLCAIAFRATIVPSAHFRARAPRVRELVGSICRALTDRGLLGLFAAGFLLMSCFVTIYNFLGFRLLGPAFGLSGAVVGLIFGVYLAGVGSSAFIGRMVDRYGRPPMLMLTTAVTLAGLLLLAMGNLVAVIAGLVVTTGGFFAAHSVASSWVSVRSANLGVQGSAVYVLFYYLGSSVGGTVGGLAFSADGWRGVTYYTCALVAAALVIAVLLRNLRPAPAVAQAAAP